MKEFLHTYPPLLPTQPLGSIRRGWDVKEEEEGGEKKGRTGKGKRG